MNPKAVQLYCTFTDLIQTITLYFHFHNMTSQVLLFIDLINNVENPLVMLMACFTSSFVDFVMETMIVLKELGRSLSISIRVVYKSFVG